MFNDQQSSGYRNGGGASSGRGGANAAAGKAPTASVPPRRGGKQALNGAANNSGSGQTAAMASSTAAAAASSPANAAPVMPLAAPRSQQLGSPRSPADYQSSPTGTGSPQGSPAVRGGSAFASPSSPNNNGNISGSYGKGEVLLRSGLEKLVRDEGLMRINVPLAELRKLPGTNTVKVGYDGTALLRNMTEIVQEQDPTATFTVTMPPVLFQQWEEMISEVNATGDAVASASPGTTFSPVFVFDGIPLSPAVDSPNAPNPAPPGEITVFNGQGVSHAARSMTYNVKSLMKERFRIDDDLEAFLIRCLRDNFSEVFRAPYNAWAQLSAFFSLTNRYISEVYGSLELLAFPGVDRVVTRFNPVAQTFDYVDKQAVLAVVNRQVVGAALSERDLGYLIMADTVQAPYRLHALADKTLGDLIAVLASSEALPGNRGRGYNFSKAFATDLRRQVNVNFSLLDAPVFTHDAKAEPLYIVYGMAPHSSLRASETFGTPLPAVLYMSLFAGLVMPSQLASIAHGMLCDRWPLIDSVEYRRLLDFLTPIRLRTCQHLILNVPSLQLPRRWYRQYMQRALAKERVVEVGIPNEIPLYDWEIAGKPQLEESETPYFSTVLPLYQCSSLPRPNGTVDGYYHTVTETTAAVLLKAMDQLGYFTHSVEEDTMEIPVGLHTDASTCTYALQYFQCGTLSEYGLLCIELLRTRALHDLPIQISPNATKSYRKETRRGVRFASRLLSIIPMNIGGTWGGPFDPEIAAFGVIARAVSRTTRQLMESITLTTFCTGRTTLPMTEMYQVLARLPMGLPIEFGAGHLMNYILHNEECTLAELKSVFPECSALHDDLTTLFWFWSMAIPAICRISTETVVDMAMVHLANEVVIEAALRLDPVNFGYVANCRAYFDNMGEQGDLYQDENSAMAS